MKYKIKAYNIWELGGREKQEDSLFPPYGQVNDNDRLFIVCDGMGGHSAGEVASKTVCDSMSEYILNNVPDPEGEFTDDDFNVALEKAYDALDAADNDAPKKMGTTLTFLKLHSQGATIAHIGDSRVYHIRPGKDRESTEILFQTRDHSLVNDLIKIGEITPEEAKTSRQKNIITRAMQPNLEYRSRADLYHTADIKPGDYFLLCSDGILENMEDDNIRFLFSENSGDDENKVNMIVELTEENRDNHTAIIVHVMDVIDPISVSKPEYEVVPASMSFKPEFHEEVEEEPGTVKVILDKIFKNHVLSSVVLIAIMAIAIIVIIFRNSSRENKKEMMLAELKTYEMLIADGEKYLNEKKYEDALLKFNEALTYEEKYSSINADEFDKNVSGMIETTKQAQNDDEMLSAMNRDKDSYLALIEEGDNLTNNRNYTEAVSKYEEAKKYEEKYVSTEFSQEFNANAENKIVTVNQKSEFYTTMLRDKNSYLALINEGDKLLSGKKYDAAISKYKEAKGIENKYAGTEFSQEFNASVNNKIEKAQTEKNMEKTAETSQQGNENRASIAETKPNDDKEPVVDTLKKDGETDADSVAVQQPILVDEPEQQ